jgi:two-component sensor histidine kinase/ActR/RegA family two-component response regulator
MRARVLLIDDNADDRSLAAREVEAVAPDAEVTEVDSAAALDAALAAGRVDLAVVDYALRWSDGIKVTHRLKEADARTAVIMFTGSGNEEVAVEAMKAGLDDYVPKGQRYMPRLGSAIRSALGRSRDRRALARAEGDLRRSLTQQQLLLRELHHRVKNNLQLVVSLVRLRAAREEDERFRQVLSDMAERVQSLARVQDKIYAADDLSRVDFRGYLDAVATSLRSMHGNGHVTVRLEDMDRLDVPVERAVPLGLMCYELLLNAFRHAFPNRPTGEVVVSMHGTEDGSGAEIRIEDDGVGFQPPEPPQDGEREGAPDTLGWALVRELAIEAEVGVAAEPREGGGTRIRILLPRMALAERETQPV